LIALECQGVCAEKGLLRLEGKEYIVKDGDVLVIRHG
jgi:ribosome-binding ATPase YchF (GTP1/OBG family)